MSLPSLSVDEIITTINRSSLPTILVEGKTDAAIYRWIEKKLIETNADIIECGGRIKLINVFERRSEITTDTSVAFLADRDMWLYTEIPEKYSGIIFTKGYSIENDLIDGSIDHILKLFHDNEMVQLEQIYKEILPWYTYEIFKYLQGQEYKLDYSIHYLIDESIS